MRILSTIVILTALLALSLVIAGCGAGGPALSAVTVSPDTISPNGDAKDDVASISYHIGGPSQLTIRIADDKGNSYLFRNQEPRTAGDYTAKLSGVIETPLALTPSYTGTKASVLPDGRYTLTVETDEGQGRIETAQTGLTISGGDPTPPGFGDFSVFTPSFDDKLQAVRGDKVIFSPNRDGIGDRVAASYWLTKEATVEVYLLKMDDPNHIKYPISQVAKLKPGRQSHDYEGGVDLGNTPPPNGDYLVVGEATDAIGNHAVITRPLTIADGGVPLAQIISASITPVSLPLGGLLKIEVTVQNVGTVAIRSQGPYSGTIYTSDENYNSKNFIESPGVFRVGADFEGNSAGRIYPFRWGFQNDRLLPGERQTVMGYVRMVNKPTAPSIYFWTGLIHEQVRVVNDKVTPVQVSIGF